jgi:hypothetical protein
MMAAMESRVVQVICYSGHAADVEPRAVVVDGRRLAVVAIERRWREPEARFFTVRLTDGTKSVLRQDVTSGDWTMTLS